MGKNDIPKLTLHKNSLFLPFLCAHNVSIDYIHDRIITSFWQFEKLALENGKVSIGNKTTFYGCKKSKSTNMRPICYQKYLILGKFTFYRAEMKNKYAISARAGGNGNFRPL